MVLKKPPGKVCEVRFSLASDGNRPSGRRVRFQIIAYGKAGLPMDALRRLRDGSSFLLLSRWSG